MTRFIKKQSFVVPRQRMSPHLGHTLNFVGGWGSYLPSEGLRVSVNNLLGCNPWPNSPSSLPKFVRQKWGGLGQSEPL